MFDCRVLDIHISELIRGTIGTGEKAVKALFQQAKQISPCIVFFDEFQSVFTSRSSGPGSGGNSSTDIGQTLSSTLSGCFDDLMIWNKFSGENNAVTVIAATNEPWSIDKSFLRSGRFEKLMFIGPPDRPSRLVYFQHKCASWPSKQIDWLVTSTENFTGADITLLEQRALQIHLRSLQESAVLTPPPPHVNAGVPMLDPDPDSGSDCVSAATASFESFKKALKRTSATVTKEDMEDYRSWERLRR